MADRRRKDSAWGTSGRLSSDKTGPAHDDARGADTARGPREDHPAEARSVDPADVPHVGPAGAVQPVGPASAASPFDPELEADLGAEFPFRGDQLEADADAARAEAAEWREKGMRAQAEFENTRKRLEARHADALLRAGERIVEALFPVLDDLDRAIDHAVSDGSDITGGLEAVRTKLLAVLAREGCTVIDPFGAAFDPERHQAVQMRDDVDVPDSTVVDVLQKGYEMHERILRPAMVVVSTGGPDRE